MVNSRDDGKVFVVRSGYVLYWKDIKRTVRGTEGYAVRSDDPLIGEQLNKLRVAPEGTVPVPPSEWPLPGMRTLAAKLAGPEWLTDAERNEWREAKAAEAAEAAAQSEKETRIKSEIPPPDEPVGSGSSRKGQRR